MVRDSGGNTKSRMSGRHLFHRAAAAELVIIFDSRFRANLHAQLIAAYNVYGDDENVIPGRRFLTAFPRDRARLDVALMAATLWRGATQREELTALRSTVGRVRPAGRGRPLGANSARHRDPVLDRYLAPDGLLQRPLDADAALSPRNDGKNPNDPANYETPGGFGFGTE